MGAVERRFSQVVWIDFLLFKDIVLFIFLSVPEATRSSLLFLLHVPHIFTSILGFASLAYPGSATTLRPLMVLACLSILFDIVALVGHLLVASETTGRLFGNQLIFAGYAVAFVINTLMLIVRSPRPDETAVRVPPGVMTDMATVLGGTGGSNKRN